MLFNSVTFLYAFLPVAYLVFWSLKTSERRYQWLTLTGYVFYGFWDYRFCALMAFSTAVSYLAGLGMLKWDRVPSRRRLCLVVPVATDLALLIFFKYTGLVPGYGPMASAAPGAAAERTHVPRHPADRNFLLHVSHHQLHRRLLPARRSRRHATSSNFRCYVSLFSSTRGRADRPLSSNRRRIWRDSAPLDRTANWHRGWLVLYHRHDQEGRTG